MASEPVSEIGTGMEELAGRIDVVLFAYLERCADEMEQAVPGGRIPVDEIERLLRAGGKRMRPAFCYWGYRAVGGESRSSGDAIVRASAAMELLHTMALVHDDLIDATDERRGAPTTVPWMVAQAPLVAPSVDRDGFGRSVAVLVGDLAAVLADRLLLESGFEPHDLARGLAVYHRMRIDTAVGQFLDVSGRGSELAPSREMARLKGGAYTVEGPLLVGAALADAGTPGSDPRARDALERYGRALGEAFQLADDLRDHDAAPGVDAGEVHDLVHDARTELLDAPIDDEARDVLDRMARSVSLSVGEA